MFFFAIRIESSFFDRTNFKFVISKYLLEFLYLEIHFYSYVFAFEKMFFLWRFVDLQLHADYLTTLNNAGVRFLGKLSIELPIHRYVCDKLYKNLCKEFCLLQTITPIKLYRKKIPTHTKRNFSTHIMHT